MITFEKLLGVNQERDLTPELIANGKELLGKLLKVEAAYGKPLSITNALRTMIQHLEIYRKKGITDKAKIPMKSWHLYFLAADVEDVSGDFNKWCKANEKLLKEIGIWLEIRQGCWQHLQIRPYGSYREGKPLWFTP